MADFKALAVRVGCGNMEIRRMKPADIPEIMKLYRKTFHPNFHAYGELMLGITDSRGRISEGGFRKYRSILRKILNGKAFGGVISVSRVAEEDEELVGFLTAFIYKDTRSGYLSDIGVGPKFRKRGIAITLIKAALEDFKARKCRYAFANVNLKNKTSISLFRKFARELDETFVIEL